jgi:hypothetical protein
MVMRIPAIALAILMSSCFAQSHAADVVNYGPAPDWVEPVPVPKDDGNMADAPAKALLRSYQLRFTETSSENYSEDYIRLQTPQGVQALGNIVLPWRPDTDVFTVHKFQCFAARTISSMPRSTASSLPPSSLMAWRSGTCSMSLSRSSGNQS